MKRQQPQASHEIEQETEQIAQEHEQEQQGQQMLIEPTEQEQRREGTVSKSKNSAKKLLTLFQKVDKGEKASLARSGTESLGKQHGHKRNSSLQDVVSTGQDRQRPDGKKETPGRRSSSAHQLNRSANAMIKGEARATDISGITFGGLAYIPNKNQLVIAGNEGDIEICDLQGERRQKLKKAHVGEIFRIHYLEEKNLIFSAGLGGIVKVWHHNSSHNAWEHAGRFDKHTKTVFALGYLPASKLMVSGGEDEHIRVWKPDGRHEEVYHLKTNELNIGSLCGIKKGDKEMIVAGFDKGYINVIEVSTPHKKTLYTMKAKGYILNLSYFEEKSLLFSGSDLREIRVFRLTETKYEALRIFPTNSSVKNFAVFLDKDLLISNEENRHVTLWKLETGKAIKTLEDRSFGAGLALIKGLDKIVTGSKKEVRLWDIN